MDKNYELEESAFNGTGVAQSCNPEARTRDGLRLPDLASPLGRWLSVHTLGLWWLRIGRSETQVCAPADEVP